MNQVKYNHVLCQKHYGEWACIPCEKQTKKLEALVRDLLSAINGISTEYKGKRFNKYNEGADLNQFIGNIISRAKKVLGEK